MGFDEQRIFAEQQRKTAALLREQKQVMEDSKSPFDAYYEGLKQSSSASEEFGTKIDGLKSTLDGLGQSVPEIGNLVMALRNPYQAAGMMIGYFITEIKKMAQARLDAEMLKVQLEQLSSTAATFATIADNIAAAHARAREEMSGMTSDVDRFGEASDKAGKSIVALRTLQSTGDDEMLRARNLQIDQMNLPDSQKNLLKDRARRQREREKGDTTISQAEQDAKQKAGQAYQARQLAERKGEEADKLVPSMQDLAKQIRQTKDAVAELERTAPKAIKLHEDDIAKAQLKLKDAVRKRESGPDGRNAPPTEEESALTAKISRSKNAITELRDNLDFMRGLADKDTIESEADRLSVLQKQRDQLLEERKQYIRKAEDLEKQSAELRNKATNAKREEKVIGPLRESNDFVEQRAEYLRRRQNEEHLRRDAARNFINASSKNGGEPVPVPAALQGLSEAQIKSIADGVDAASQETARAITQLGEKATHGFEQISSSVNAQLKAIQQIVERNIRSDALQP